jgi:hypothetical protein
VPNLLRENSISIKFGFVFVFIQLHNPAQIRLHSGDGFVFSKQPKTAPGFLSKPPHLMFPAAPGQMVNNKLNGPPYA